MKSFIVKAVLLLALIAALLFSLNRIQTLKRECDRLQSNQSVLIEKSQSDAAEKQRYKVSDSLNAIKVRELELTLDEYKTYRAKDLQLIRKLKESKSSDVSKVVSPELITNNELSLDLSDSLLIDTLHNRVAVLKCFDYNSEYCTVSGCVDVESDTVDIQVCNRESLKVIETVTYKRFLGFLWKTKKIKSKQVDVVSYNPNTEIVSCDYVSIVE